MTTFIYDSTKGTGVPGLPHEITRAEAEAQGVLSLLEEAISNGSYVEKDPTPKGAGKKKE